MSGSFVVMDDKLRQVYRAKLAKDAYAIRTKLAKEYNRCFTVAYLPSDFSIQSQTVIGKEGIVIKYTQRRKRA